MGEFDWIQTYLAPLAGPEGLALLDDAALYSPSADTDLVLTLDTLVEGVHFFKGEYGATTAERLLISNLSDLAAKGARPIGYLLSTSWPSHLKSDDLEKWMAGFSKGLETIQSAYDFRLFGGDTVKSSGAMTISATLIGVVPKGKMVKRSGAQSGDDIWVTGNIGDAHLGLLAAQNSLEILDCQPSGEDFWVWEEAFCHPTPQLLFRKTLRQFATACADVSDGLLSEASHIARASGHKLLINIKDIPLSEASQKWCRFGVEEDRRVKLATGGDDYQLLLTAHPENAKALKSAAKQLDIKLSRIGYVSEGERVVLNDMTGKPINLPNLGYSHF